MQRAVLQCTCHPEVLAAGPAAAAGILTGSPNRHGAVFCSHRIPAKCSVLPQYPCCRLTAVGSCSGYYPPPISAQHSTAGDDSILLLQGLAWKCFASSWRSRTLPQMFSFYYCINVPWHMTMTDDAIKREHRIGSWLIFKWNILDVIVWTIKMQNGMEYYLVPSLGLL